MSTLSDNIENTYKIIRGYLPRETALNLAKNIRSPSYETTDSEGKIVIGEHYDFSDKLDMNAISIDKIAYLNEFIGDSKLLPTYTYSRIYKNGSILPKHKDREACEVSLSIHLDGDASSTFYIRDKNNEVASIDLEPGDAVLYDGINAEHWRDAYEGESYVQTFHHYVFSDGKNVKEYSNIKYASTDRDIHKYIKIYKGLVPNHVCKHILSAAEKEYSDRWEPASTVDPSKDETAMIISDARVCDILSIKSTDPIDNVIFEYVNLALKTYAKTFPNFKVTTDCGYNVLRYKPGGKFKRHTDQCSVYNREVSIIVNLNDGYEGGQLKHFGGTSVLDLGVGDVCLFPSNFMYDHEICPITSGTRYSIISWAV